MMLLGARPSLSWETIRSIRSPLRLAKVLMTLSGGTTGSLTIMSFSRVDGLRTCEVRAISGFIISAVLSRYQKNVEPGFSVMACRRAGTLDHEGGEFRRGYCSVLGKNVR
jgi:hypothetical protein